MIKKRSCYSAIVAVILCCLLSACTSTKVAKAQKAIDSIGTVTLDSLASIDTAIRAYEALEEKDRAEVGNYEILVAAQKEYDSLVAIRDVESIISNIGDVSEDSGNAIDDAQTAYNSLTDDEKQRVTNLDLLESSLADYNVILLKKAFGKTLDEFNDEYGENTLYGFNYVFSGDYSDKSISIDGIASFTKDQFEEDTLYNRNIHDFDAAKSELDILREKCNSALIDKGINDIAYYGSLQFDDGFIIYSPGENGMNYYSELRYDKENPRDNCDSRTARWGDDVDTVVRYETGEIQRVEDELVGVTHVKVSNIDSYVYYSFDKDYGLFSGMYFIMTSSYSTAGYITNFGILKEAITGKYGQPSFDDVIITNYLGYYTDEVTALNLGYSEHRAEWELENTSIYLVMYAEGYNKIRTILMYNANDYEESPSISGI